MLKTEYVILLHVGLDATYCRTKSGGWTRYWVGVNDQLFKRYVSIEEAGAWAECIDKTTWNGWQAEVEIGKYLTLV